MAIETPKIPSGNSSGALKETGGTAPCAAILNTVAAQNRRNIRPDSICMREPSGDSMPDFRHSRSIIRQPLAGSALAIARVTFIGRLPFGARSLRRKNRAGALCAGRTDRAEAIANEARQDAPYLQGRLCST